MLNLSAGILKKLPVVLPDLISQKKIAAILSAYDDLIENNLQRIRLLEEVAQITYEEWFVRMKFPGHETAQWDKETGLPEGWKELSFGNACGISGGGTPSREVDEYWNNGTIAWFSPTDLSKAGTYCLLDSSQKITDTGLKESSAKLLQPNSFMMTSRATIGLFALIDKPFCTNQGFINVTPNESCHKLFLFFNLKSRVDELYNHASGATFPEISKSTFKKIKIIFPNENVLKSFDSTVAPVINTMMNMTRQNELLREARDILLPRLMTGVIDVDQVEVPEALLARVA
jgi:type I restriction enzyme S subunit